MKIAFTTTFDARDVHNWSGTPFHMSHALAIVGKQVDYIGSLKRQLPPFFKAKQTLNKLIANQRLSPRFNCVAAKYYSEQVAKQLATLSAEVVISPLINPIAYLDCKQPIVLWTDALYAALVGFYPPFAYHSADTIAQGNKITTECLSRCSLAIFSSDWAAHSAIELYGVSRDKVKVVPFGANLIDAPKAEDIYEAIKHRKTDKVKLLFLAKSWERKGGDVVLAVAAELHKRGVPVELTIVGYTPSLIGNPSYVRCLGFLSKHSPEGKAILNQLLAETHFLFVPSRAEAYGIVFCEASAFGVPSLTTHVGGIGSAVRDNINGMTFGLDASVDQYCGYIMELMGKPEAYQALARSSRNEFDTRLNWKTAAENVVGMIKQKITS